MTSADELPTAAPAQMPEPRQPWLTRAELGYAARLVAALVVVGVIAGMIWRLWATTPTRGLVYYNSAIVPDETEGFISSDGRFAVITAVIGLAAGLLAWRAARYRGPVTAAALALGGLAGAALTNLAGNLIGGGSTAGKLGTQLPRLPLKVHAWDLLFVEAALALLVYLLGTLFASADDLGNPAVPDPALSST